MAKACGQRAGIGTISSARPTAAQISQKPTNGNPIIGRDISIIGGNLQKEKIKSVAKRNWLLRVPSPKGSSPCKFGVPE